MAIENSMVVFNCSENPWEDIEDFNEEYFDEDEDEGE